MVCSKNLTSSYSMFCSFTFNKKQVGISFKYSTNAIICLIYSDSHWERDIYVDRERVYCGMTGGKRDQSASTCNFKPI